MTLLKQIILFSQTEYFVNGDDPLCNNYDDTSNLFRNELQDSVKTNDYQLPCRSKFDSE